jgi:hypothetical protein
MATAHRVILSLRWAQHKSITCPDKGAGSMTTATVHSLAPDNADQGWQGSTARSGGDLADYIESRRQLGSTKHAGQVAFQYSPVTSLHPPGPPNAILKIGGEVFKKIGGVGDLRRAQFRVFGMERCQMTHFVHCPRFKLVQGTTWHNSVTRVV